MKNFEAVVKNNRWLKSECTPQFTSGPLVPFLSHRRQQSPSSELHSRVTYYPTRAEDEMLLLTKLILQLQPICTYTHTSHNAYWIQGMLSLLFFFFPSTS